MMQFWTALQNTIMHTSSRVVCIIFWCNAVLLPGDLKEVALLVGLQQGYTKYMFLTCNLSERDGRLR